MSDCISQEKACRVNTFLGGRIAIADFGVMEL